MITKKMIWIVVLMSQHAVVQSSFKAFSIFPTLVSTSLMVSYGCHQYCKEEFDDIVRQQQQELYRLYQEQCKYDLGGTWIDRNDPWGDYPLVRRSRLYVDYYIKAIDVQKKLLEETKQRLEQERMARMPDMLALLADTH